MFKNLIYLTIFSISLSVQATPLAELPSVVPEAPIRPEASDLIYNGVNLTPREARKLQETGFDLSTLDPDSNTDLWKPNIRGHVSDDLGVQEDATFNFVRILETPIKSFRFVVMNEKADGSKELLQVFLGKRLQTYLLRRNLMRKMGYQIPAMQYVQKLNVQFSSATLKKDFIHSTTNGLKWNAQGDVEWIRNLDDEESSLLQLQDVVVMPAQAEVTNLTLGVITPDFVQGRRVINSLIVPYALVDVRESINGFRWYPGLRKSNSVYLPLEDPEQFSTTWSDARWAMRKIIPLKRTDFEEVVADIGYPEPAQKLLVEKLISRRNEMARLFKLEAEKITFNPGISHGEHLKDGELLKGQWPGLAPRLSFPEEPSLISGKELTSLFKSKGISTIIQELVRRVNDDLIPRTNIQKKAVEKQKDKLIDDLVKFVKTGKKPDGGLGLWTTPFAGGNIIASREVVAGTFLGSDNRVQLVDTLGFGVETGLYIGVLGLKPKQMLDASVGLSYVRQYSHLRPLTGIEPALKEPYKNMLVPLLQRKWANTINPELFENWSELEVEERAKLTKEIITDFKDLLGNGESLIISDNIVGNAGIRAGYNFADRIRALGEFKAQKLLLWRLHILRKGDELHVYKDFGNAGKLQLLVSLRAGVEVLSIRLSGMRAKATTDFYTVDLDTEEDPDILQSRLIAVRDVLLERGVNRLTQVVDPARLEHNLGEAQFEVDFLWMNYLGLKSTDWLDLTRSGEDYPERYLRKFVGSRSGNDYQSLAVDVVNELISELTDQNIEVPNSTSGDPADTLFGKSKARYSYFEAEVMADNSEIIESFVGIQYRWRGWQSKRKQIEKIIDEFSDRYNFEFYNEEAFQQLKVAELYTLNLRIFIYDYGIRYAMNLGEDEVKRIVTSYWTNKLPRPAEYPYLESEIQKAIDDLTSAQRLYGKAMARGQWDKAGARATRFLNIVEKNLTYEGFQEIVGGTRNFLIQPILTGFLRGEDGKLAEVPVEGNEIGQIGSDRPQGPMTSTQQELGMSESEFFVYWLMRRL